MGLSRGGEIPHTTQSQPLIDRKLLVQGKNLSRLRPSNWMGCRGRKGEGFDFGLIHG